MVTEFILCEGTENAALIDTGMAAYQQWPSVHCENVWVSGKMSPCDGRICENTYEHMILCHSVIL